MSVDARFTPDRDILAAARERVRIAPIPDWVVPCAYSPEFKPKTPAPATHLLLDRQLHAERQETFIRVAMRLETMQAVQHYSQWRLEFSPQVHSIVLHSIKIRRAGAEAEHAILDRIRFLQREAGLEGFVIDGWVTLLLLLEDVRPGDILEWCYTEHFEPPLLPQSCTALFRHPENAHLGRHHLLVRFAESRPLRWKSSAPDLTPVEQRHDGEIHWLWTGEDYACPKAEENAPDWYAAHSWIQISDCPDWQTVATAFSSNWTDNVAADALAVQAQEIIAAEADLPARVAQAIRFVQDEFRYLSVSLELGGQVPADSETVLRRRYGDCKDLAFLLVQLLRRLGADATPVLVNMAMRMSIQNMLPAPGLFNHAIVEYHVGDEVRWVDATLKGQGGDALNRVIPDYGLGLRVDVGSTDLIRPPAASLDGGAYELKESFLLDTNGGWSSLAVTITATRMYAENFRGQFANESLESVAQQRLQACSARFPQTRRLNSLQYRDDRAANRFVLAEAFEISSFLMADENPGYCVLHVQNYALAGVLPLVPEAPGRRRAPLALPYPCQVIYTIEIESPGLELSALPACRFKNDFFEFTCRSRAVRRFTTATFTLRVLADSVPAVKLLEYERHLQEVIPLSGLNAHLRVGHPRMRRPADFGALPGPPLPATTTASPVAHPPRAVPSPRVAIVNAVPLGSTDRARAEAEKTVLLEGSPHRHRTRHPRRHHRSSWHLSKSEVFWILGFILAAAVTLGSLLLIGEAFH